MSAQRRIARLNEQLRREISRLLQEEVKDPRIGSATITGVEVTADLSIARIFVTVHGSSDTKDATLEGFRAAAPFIRTVLGRELRLRRVPELRFELDETLDRAMRIEQLLREAQSHDKSPSDDTGEAGEGSGDPETSQGKG